MVLAGSDSSDPASLLSQVLTLSGDQTTDDGLVFQSQPTIFPPASTENRARPWGQAGEGFVLLSSLLILSVSVI